MTIRPHRFAAVVSTFVCLVGMPLAALAASVVSGTVTATGLASSGDIVVSLEAPSLKVAPPAKALEMDQKGMAFVPHVLPVVRGATVRFLNSDPVGHNVFSPEGRYNLGTWPQGETRDRTYERPGVYTQLCRVHPEMEAFIVVLDTPYFALTSRDGSFAIKDVPPGKYTLVAWSEKLKATRQPVTVEETPVTVRVTMSR